MENVISPREIAQYHADRLAQAIGATWERVGGDETIAYTFTTTDGRKLHVMGYTEEQCTERMGDMVSVLRFVDGAAGRCGE